MRRQVCRGCILLLVFLGLLLSPYGRAWAMEMHAEAVKTQEAAESALVWDGLTGMEEIEAYLKQELKTSGRQASFRELSETLAAGNTKELLSYCMEALRQELLGELQGKNRMAGRLLALGIPMGLQFSITAIGTIIVQGAVNIYGAVYMAGFSAAGKLQNIIVTVFTAFGATVATYVGQNRGAGKMDRVHKGVRYTQIMVFVWSAVTMVLVYFFGEEMTLLFVSKTETEVLHAAEVYFRTVFWAYPFLGSIFIYRNALQGMGYGLVPMLGGVFELAARALIVLLVAGKTSFFGVCLADPAAWISALIPLIPYYIYVMKKYEKQKQLEG